MEPAYTARRGSVATPAERERLALSAERTCVHATPPERKMRTALGHLGFKTTPQKAEGPFNIDLAAFPVAVEVIGPSWGQPNTRLLARHPRRTRYLLDRGWSLIFVRDGRGLPKPWTAAAKYVVALADRLRREPALRGQYRVIRSNGKELVRGCMKDDQFPVITPLRPELSIRCTHEDV